MNKFMDFFQEKLVPPLVKLGNQRHLKAVRNGLSLTIPFVVVGSLFLILSSLPFKWWKGFIGSYAAKLSAPVNATFGVLALLAVIGIGYSLAKDYELDPISGAIISVVGFLLTQLTPKYQLDTGKFGAEGLFTAIIIALVAVEIYRFFVTKGIIIKMPEGVPPAIASSFAALLPGGAVILLVWVIRVVLGFDITAFLSTLFSPLVFALNTLPGILIFTVFGCLLWAVGIHGDSIMGSIGTPILLQYLTANSAAFLAGEPIPYITAAGFGSMFINIGGTGATIAIAILMVKSRSEVYKSLGKLCLPSAIFEINEPIMFGFPVVLNPLMLIPFILTPAVLTVGTYLLMYFDIIARPVTMVPWTMPPVIGPFLTTGGDWRAAVWSAISVILAVLVYYPFFKTAEKQQIQNEKEEKVSGKTAEA